jgi:agmatinase
MKKLVFGEVPEGFYKYEDSEIVIVPVPYDGTSTWMKGSDKGPEAIINASWNMYLYDIETDSEVHKRGIFTDDPVNESAAPEKMTEAVEKRVNEHITLDKFTVTLGGEHSVTVGTARAHANRYKNLSVLQLDAHADLMNKYRGSEYNHACVMARIKELCPIVQVGVRSIDPDELPLVDRDRIFFAHEIYSHHNWIDQAISRLTDEVYVTIDLDVFDISLMPSTGTPEPGGLYWYDVLTLLKRLTEKRKVVGFDLVELCPNERSKPYELLAAKLLYTFLSYIFTKRD